MTANRRSLIRSTRPRLGGRCCHRIRISLTREQPQAETLQVQNPAREIGANLPQRGRSAHARQLIEELAQIAPEAQQRAEEQKAQGIDAGIGIYLVFESEPGFELKFESLEFTRSGIELCAVRRLPDNRMQATVFAPDGKLGFFLKRIEAYRDSDTPPRRDGSDSPQEPGPR